MNLQLVAMRPGQRLQCARCHTMAPAYDDPASAYNAPGVIQWHQRTATRIFSARGQSDLLRFYLGRDDAAALDGTEPSTTTPAPSSTKTSCS